MMKAKERRRSSSKPTRCEGLPERHLEPSPRAQRPGCAGPGWSAGRSCEDRSADSRPPSQAGSAGRTPADKSVKI